MAIVIDDKFTVGSNTDLDAHTPTDVGTGWTEIENTGDTSRKARILASTDRVKINTTDGNDRKLYTAQGTYTVNDYDVEVDVQEDDSADDPFWLLGRVTDSSNYYGAAFIDGAGTDVFIVKKVTGTVTDLASADSDFNSGTWAGVTIKFEIRDATKKSFGDTTELLSTTDDVLTSVGEAGMAWGNIRLSTDDAGALWNVDNFLVTEITAVGNPWYHYAQQH